MAEALKENFILLSKIAKEKKYAQEYLSLLARRGDLGSIRIGKRWYTTEKWMNDFIELSEKKKAMAREVAPEIVIAAPEREIKAEVVIEKVEKPQMAEPGLEEWLKNVKTQPAEVVKCKIKSSFSEQAVKISPAVRERADMQHPQSIGIKIDIADKVRMRDLQSMKAEIMPKKAEDIRVRLERPVQPRVSTPVMDQPQKIGIQHHHSHPPRRIASMPRPAYIQRPVPIQITPSQNPLRQSQANLAEEKVFYFKREAAFSSPDLSKVEEDVSTFSFFPRLAFSMATMLIFFLIISASLLYREKLQALAGGGKVAGVSTQKTEADSVKNSSEAGFGEGLRNLKSATSYYLANLTDKSRESVSFSQVMLKVLKEKEDLSQ